MFWKENGFLNPFFKSKLLPKIEWNEIFIALIHIKGYKHFEFKNNNKPFKNKTMTCIIPLPPLKK